MSASDGSCCCAAKLADAVPVSMASSKRILGLLEMTLIAVLLQTRSVGLRDRSLSSDRRPVWCIRLSEPSPFSFIDVRHHGFPTCSGQPCGHMNTPEAQTVVPVIREIGRASCWERVCPEV